MVKKPHTNWDPPSNREGGGTQRRWKLNISPLKIFAGSQKEQNGLPTIHFQGRTGYFFFGREKDDEEIRANLFLPTIFLNRNIHASFAGLIV